MSNLTIYGQSAVPKPWKPTCAHPVDDPTVNVEPLRKHPALLRTMSEVKACGPVSVDSHVSHRYLVVKLYHSGRTAKRAVRVRLMRDVKGFRSPKDKSPNMNSMTVVVADVDVQTAAHVASYEPLSSHLELWLQVAMSCICLELRKRRRNNRDYQRQYSYAQRPKRYRVRHFHLRPLCFGGLCPIAKQEKSVR